MSDQPRRPIRVANFSGMTGDRFSALEEAVNGEPVDAVIGDYMAEITMSLIAARRGEKSSGHYAKVFLRQIAPLLPAIAEKGIKVVTNAGMFNPAGLAEALRGEIKAAGVALTVAHVEGDDVTSRVEDLTTSGQLQHMDTGREFTLNNDDVAMATAYLGGWGIAAALGAGADIVITGRVADASLVLGPAAWWHQWQQDDWDAVAGAVAAAHVIECGPQSVGGNFPGFASIPNNTRLGFPIAEVAADGSSVITKRVADEGTVTVDTVTAQLMYEIQGPAYLNPDVVLRVDSIELTQIAPDRVRISGVQGMRAPETTKVGLHLPGGYHGAMWVFPTGLDIEDKLDMLRRQAADAATGLDLDHYIVTPCGRPVDDPQDQYQATVATRIAAASSKQGEVASFLSRIPTYTLGGIPGFYFDLHTGTNEERTVDFWPGLMRQEDVEHAAVLEDGRRIRVAPPKGEPFAGQPNPGAVATPTDATGPTRKVPLGDVAYARTGDKSGNANLGVWTPKEHAGAYPWLAEFLTEERLTNLLGLEDHIRVERYPLPNINGLLFVLRDYFGSSGSANIALDQIGKSLGEFLRAKHVEVPVAYLD